MHSRTYFRFVTNIVVGVLLLLVGFVFGSRYGMKLQSDSVKTFISRYPQLNRVYNYAVPEEYRKIDFAQFWDVWSRLESSYVDPEKLDAQKMVYGAIEGMTSALGDPYTVYLPPEDQQASVEDLQGSFDGVGIQLGFKDSTLAVMSPLKGTPADKAGVVAGEYILKIKDEAKNIEQDTADISLPEAVRLIRGKKGTSVTLTLLRAGERPRDVVLQRDTILVPSVEITFIERDGKKFAHLILSKFGDSTDLEWDQAVQKILAEPSVSGIILDLQNNSGGYLQGAIDYSSDFISDGIVVIQQGRDSRQEYTVSRRARLSNYPLVVLINGGTASAAEIMSGALRDRKGTTLVGEKSFGKGTVQEAIDGLPAGAGLHVTIAKWLLPQGDWIHEKGIEPTVSATDDSATTEVNEVLEKAIEEIVKSL